MTTNFPSGAAALAALLVAIPASAVSLNPRGVGEVLIDPYYTVNNNQDTLISIGNASNIGKMISVRFAEGYNGRDALTFMLFLSPHDVWTAAITQTADDGGARLITGDTSCTYPAIPTEGVQFSSAGYDGTGPRPPDSGPQGIMRTREGFVEFIAFADVVAGSPTDVRITHVQDGNPGEGVPPGCDEITGVNLYADEIAPTSGLYGSASIVNVGLGTYFAYNANAITGFSEIPLWNGSQTFPSLQDANSSEAIDGAARAYLADNDGHALLADYAFGLDAVTAVFMSDALYNEYLVDSSLGANTDWVVTFPTKHFYTDPIYSGDAPLQPFEQAFLDGTAPMQVTGSVFDREEGSTSLVPDCTFCPPPFPPPALDYVVNVVSFLNLPAPTSGTPSGVFGSVLTSLNVTPYGNAGAVTLDLVDGNSDAHQLQGGVDPQGIGIVLHGLPAIGFMAYNIINARAQPGMLANYGGGFGHRTTMSCTGPADECGSAISGNSR